MIIALDGPAASGKSTTAKSIATMLNLLYIDTGAMYRTVALFADKNGVELSDFEGLKNLLKSIKIEFKGSEIFLNGENVSEEIRTPKITKMSSEVATIKIVRERMVEIQRQFSEDNDVILDGRDIGTVVFPNADFKFYLIATLETRAKRRYDEMRQKGVTADFEEIKKNLEWRDKNDSEREESPLRKADDAIEIDTTTLTIDEQIGVILEFIRSKNASVL